MAQYLTYHHPTKLRIHAVLQIVFWNRLLDLKHNVMQVSLYVVLAMAIHRVARKLA